MKCAVGGQKQVSTVVDTIRFIVLKSAPVESLAQSHILARCSLRRMDATRDQWQHRPSGGEAAYSQLFQTGDNLDRLVRREDGVAGDAML